MSIIIDYPWYFLFFCLLLGAAYAFALYWVRLRHKAERDFPRGLSIVLSLLRAVAVTAIAFLLFSPLVKRESSRREKPSGIAAPLTNRKSGIMTSHVENPNGGCFTWSSHHAGLS